MKISHQGGGILVISNLISVRPAIGVYYVFSNRVLPSPTLIACAVLEVSGALSDQYFVGKYPTLALRFSLNSPCPPLGEALSTPNPQGASTQTLCF